MSSKGKELREVKLAVVTVDCNSAKVVRGKHVLAMAWTVDPTVDCTVHRIDLAHIVCNIFCERPLKEWHLF